VKPVIGCRELVRVYEGGYKALQGLSLEVGEGEFVAVMGPSGCGKSTLLNILGGLLQSTTGEAFLEGKVVDEPGPDRAIVFQNHSLLPWLTVYGNIAIAVDKVFGSRKSKAERHDWVMHNLELVQMAQAKDKRPHEVSGGMKQRVGIARALAIDPKVLLMDEPFGALDAQTRESLQAELLDIHARTKKTILFVTHDLDEAVLIADRIIVMKDGRVADIMTVPLARPRPDLSIVRGLPEFNDTRYKVWRALHDEATVH